MRTELISIPTPTHPLDGVYYTPDVPSKGAAMYCHGNQMNFYVCAARFLAPHITALAYDFMPFNRRGHDSVSTYDSRECVGGAYQTVAEGIEDNEIAAKYLANKVTAIRSSSVTATAAYSPANTSHTIPKLAR
jgi:hypothetical protein